MRKTVMRVDGSRGRNRFFLAAMQGRNIPIAKLRISCADIKPALMFLFYRCSHDADTIAPGRVKRCWKWIDHFAILTV